MPCSLGAVAMLWKKWSTWRSWIQYPTWEASFSSYYTSSGRNGAIRAYELKEQQNRRVRILDLVCFIERQACIEADPIFGDLQNQSTNKGKSKSPNRSWVSKSFGSNFAMAVTQNRQSLNYLVLSAAQTTHWTSAKTSLKRCIKTNSAFFETKEICFRCLLIGHIGKDCKMHQICKVCKQAHQVLFIFRPKTLQEDT